MVFAEKVKIKGVMVVEVLVGEVEVVLSPLWKHSAMRLASCQETSQSAKKAEVTSQTGFICPPYSPHSSLVPSTILRGSQSAHLELSPLLLQGASGCPTNGSRVGFDCGCRA